MASIICRCRATLKDKLRSLGIGIGTVCLLAPSHNGSNLLRDARWCAVCTCAQRYRSAAVGTLSRINCNQQTFSNKQSQPASNKLAAVVTSPPHATSACSTSVSAKPNEHRDCTSSSFHCCSPSKSS